MRKSRTKISFFAFQDIITATTGILVLITIILTFFIKAGDEDPLSVPGIDELLAENAGLISEINDLTGAIADLEKILEEWDGKDLNEIKIDIQKLKDLIRKYENNLKGLSGPEGDVRDLINERDEKNDEYDDLVRRLDGIEAAIKNHNEALANIADPNKLFIIPEIPPGKKLLYIVLSAGKLELIEFVGENVNRQLFNNQGALTAQLRNMMPKQDYHIMFFVKPSGIQRFLELNGGMLRPGNPAPVSDLGFKLIGWEPLEEEKELDFK